jgi:hypothetical protein
LNGRSRGLAVVREKGWLLAWDDKHWLHLFNRSGQRQAQARPADALVAAACSEEGTAYVVLGSGGELSWLAPDLTPRWAYPLGHRGVAVAVDPFGQYLAASDVRGNLYFFDRQGRALCQVQSARPLHHLAFVPAAPFVVGAADYGLVACYDLMGRCVWVDGLVAHIGALAVSGDGEQIVLACFTEGIQRYDLKGKKQERIVTPEPARLAALSFDGRVILWAGLSPGVVLQDRKGYVLGEHREEKPAAALGLGALADIAALALANGRVLVFELGERA